MKAEGPRLALVENPSALPDQIEPVGPARISRLDPIVEVVDQRGKFDAQLAHACSGNGGALGLIFRAAEQNTITHIRAHLPHIGGMRLKDVNGVEGDFVAVLLGELVQGGNLPPKGRSSVATEDEDDRPLSPQGRQFGGSVVIQLFNRQTRRGITDA